MAKAGDGKTDFQALIKSQREKRKSRQSSDLWKANGGGERTIGEMQHRRKGELNQAQKTGREVEKDTSITLRRKESQKEKTNEKKRWRTRLLRRRPLVGNRRAGGENTREKRTQVYGRPTSKGDANRLRLRWERARTARAKGKQGKTSNSSLVLSQEMGKRGPESNNRGKKKF